MKYSATYKGPGKEPVRVLTGQARFRMFTPGVGQEITEDEHIFLKDNPDVSLRKAKATEAIDGGQVPEVGDQKSESE